MIYNINDEYRTPKYVVESIVNMVNGKILCPFDEEDSEFVKVFQENGFDVKYSHIKNKDFFSYTKEEVENRIIISNPPFSKSKEIFKKIYELDCKFMLLLPITKLQGIETSELFKKNGLELLVFGKRINYLLNDKIIKGVSFGSGFFCKGMLEKKLMFI